MKGLLTTILCCLLVTSYGQTVILGNYPKTVPQGKKWILPTGQEILIEVTSGTLRSGNMCNALILSSPKIVKGIVEGEYGRPNQAFAILFKQLDKVAYTNDFTYSILPVSIVDSKFSLYELQYKEIEEVGSKQIVFYPGQKVYVGECLQSIQLKEVNLTAKELAEIKKKEEEARLAELKKKQEDENRKLKAEQERRERIINSSDFFYSNELTNEKDIKITVQKEALPILYDYLQEFRTQYSFSYDHKLENYNKNVRYSGKDDYSMFDFSLYFDKQGDLKKITNNRILIKGEGTINLDLDTSWFNKLKPYISINVPASIELDGKDYIVNSYYLSFFNFYKKSSDSNVLISVNKKEEIKILSNNSTYTESEIHKLISKSKQTENLEKGKYTLKITNDKLTFRFNYFQNNDSKETVINEMEMPCISDAERL
ncbi:MAG: hypothetical protein HN691_08695 [Bacteroidetes bacterium]|nr:hypothetical protein [Bacteroidota bacterium]